MKTNTKKTEKRIDKETRLAGGAGAFAAKQGAEALLRRAVMACLLWEDLAYESGASGADNIASLIPLVSPATVCNIAVEARVDQKLRHVPLFIASEMTKYKSHRSYVGELLPRIVLRADEIAEFLAIYMKDGKHPLAKQVKIGLAQAFDNFNQYQFSKYQGADSEISLRDAMFMVHPIPATPEREALYQMIANKKLPLAMTWEQRLSSGENKKFVWEDMIAKKELGALAFLRNLRNMEEAEVDPVIIREGLKNVDGKWLLPINYLAAAKASPRYEKEIEQLMLAGWSQIQKLSGYTIFVVDVSGSMNSDISGKSKMSRMEVAKAMAMIAASVCERVTIYATAGNDMSVVHKTKLIPTRQGFGMMSAIDAEINNLGGGGIFTRQCLEYIKSQEHETPDRIIIFSDSQDCDRGNNAIPKPFGKKNYIVDVSAHSHGVNYKGVWTSEISGWSDKFLTYIAALEGVSWAQEEF